MEDDFLDKEDVLLNQKNRSALAACDICFLASQKWLMLQRKRKLFWGRWGDFDRLFVKKEFFANKNIDEKVCQVGTKFHKK